ncbi:hypothetical protein QFC22_003547 [Naganishia vaughanmartiniae]|uniref:Uncharacterized protein n=1 Tax=Naganishia vaughanmartiniae TaxID=1424756 RepID=A0ACC2X6K4_9TREE|nr:hypothetical protein QFC22_003547 [Naganishia vaughanmartiniae]
MPSINDYFGSEEFEVDPTLREPFSLVELWVKIYAHSSSSPTISKVTDDEETSQYLNYAKSKSSVLTDGHYVPKRSASAGQSDDSDRRYHYYVPQSPGLCHAARPSTTKRHGENDNPASVASSEQKEPAVVPSRDRLTAIPGRHGTGKPWKNRWKWGSLRRK